MPQNEEDQFYARQIQLSEIGEAGQQKLKNSRVLIVGAGGLGCPVLQYLSAAGVGHITIIDGDQVEISNLHRQPLYTIDDAGKMKAQIAAQNLRMQNPFIHIENVNEDFVLGNAEETVKEHDLVVDCTDNFSTNYLIHDTCRLQKIDLITASIHSFEGVIHRYNFSKEQTCLRCRSPKIPEESCAGSCAERGVIGALPGVFGSLQADIALQHLLGIETLAHATSWVFDVRSMESRKIGWWKNKTCPICTKDESLDRLHVPSDYIINHIDESYVLIDVRERKEVTKSPVNIKAMHHPLSQWNNNYIDKNTPTAIICAKGYRSLILTKKLRSEGFENVFSVKGGLENLSYKGQ